MTARQQLARLLPLATLVGLAIVGLRGQVAGPRWDGPLKAYGVIIGLALEVILGALLVAVYYREHVARRETDEALRAAATARASAGWTTPVPGTARQPPAHPAATAGDDPDDDRDVAATLRFLLKLTIGTAMAAIAVVLAVNAHLHLFTGGPPRQLIKFPKHSLAPKPHRIRAHAAAQFHFPVAPILYGLLIIALIAALAFSVWWGRRLAAAVVARPDAMPGDLEEEAEGLREAVASGRAAMADLDDARAAIIACYAAMEQTLAERGAERGAAGTPDELLERAIRSGLVRARTGHDSAARTLTTAFYEARFSTHPLGPGHRDAAARALDELAAELGEASARAGA
jgi:hypothetical protein